MISLYFYHDLSQAPNDVRNDRVKRKQLSHFGELFFIFIIIFSIIIMSLVDSRVMRINIDHDDPQNYQQ